MPKNAQDPLMPDTAPEYAQQAALCWRLKDGAVEVLLITSRDTGRWIIPKGWPIAGKSLAQSAAQESWEEAGVEGEVSHTALGQYSYEKQRSNRPALPCSVRIFGLHVTRLAEKFPERDQRRRKWFSPEKAAEKVAEPELSALLAQLAREPAALLPNLHLANTGPYGDAIDA